MQLKIISLNTNSLNLSTYNKTINGSKCRKFHYKMEALLSLNNNIICLQDIRARNNINILENYLVNHRKGDYMTFANSNLDSRGVAIIIRRDLNIIITDIVKSDDQNYIILKMRLGEHYVSLASVYGPNNADNVFYINLKNDLRNLDSDFNILMGDFNIIMSDIDRINNTGLQRQNNTNKRELKAMLDNLNLVDAFRFLNPNLKRFSYRKQNNDYRSRLDLSLISSNIVRSSNVEYLPFLGNLFDHSPMLINFRKNEIDPSKFKIADFKLKKFKGSLEIGLISIISCYIDCIITDNQTLDNLNTIFNQLWEKLVRFKSMYLHTLKHNLTNDVFLAGVISDLLSDIQASIYRHFNPEFLNSFPISVSHNIFFETCCNNLNNDVEKFLSNASKAENFFVRKLIDQKNSTCPVTSFQDYKDLENRIDLHYESIIRHKIERSRYYQVLNNEKPSKSFCSLFSNSKKQTSCCTQIKDNNGEEFEDKVSQLNYISNYFKNIYTPRVSELSIVEFLGENLANRVPKLSEEDKLMLDLPLSVQELDIALKNCNKSSAPGIDGLNNFVLEFFWPYLRYPLLNSFNNMIENERLTNNFAYVNIKLIPKKGDLGDIGQWRPISLLPCSYKLISGAICSRINKVIDKLVGIRQKGFSSSRILQNNLVNIFETIRHVNDAEIDAALCCVDFRKAFDSLSHEYIIKVFEFFNFGPSFIKLIKTIITGKQGRINVGGVFSPLFDFLAGNGQGDNASPLLFNLSIEILLIKLINSDLINQELLIKECHSHRLRLTESEAYADDENLLVTPNRDNLTKLRIIFNDFKRLSGLEINENKTQLIPLGSNRHNIEVFRNRIFPYCTYEVSNKTKILGISFDNDLNSLQDNWDNAQLKVIKLIRFWKQFSLTIIGRVNIAKIYLLPQLSFVSNCIPIVTETIFRIENIILKFIKGNDIVSNNRITSTTRSGGLGFPPVKQFLQLNKARLLRKFKLVEGDPLKSFFTQISDNPDEFDFLVDRYDFSEFFPFYGDYISCYIATKNLIFSYKDNLLNAPIFYNSILKNDTLKPDSTMTTRPINRQILFLKISNFINDQGFINSARVLAEEKGIFLNNIEFFRVRSYISRINNSYNLLDLDQAFAATPNKLILSKKKKGKFFRRFYMSDISSKNLTIKLELQEDKKTPLSELMEHSFIPNTFRVFLLKYLTNRLLCNAQLHHINIGIDQSCLCCINNGFLPPPKETIHHLLKYCPGTSALRNFMSNFFVVEALNQLEEDEICVGVNRFSQQKNMICNIIILVFIKFTYQYRRTALINDFNFLKDFIVDQLNEIFTLKKHLLRQVNSLINPNIQLESFDEVN